MYDILPTFSIFKLIQPTGYYNKNVFARFSQKKAIECHFFIKLQKNILTSLFSIIILLNSNNLSKFVASKFAIRP